MTGWRRATETTRALDINVVVVVVVCAL